MAPGQTYKHGTQMMEYEKPGDKAKLRSHAFVVDDLSKLQTPSFEDVDTSRFDRRLKIDDEGKKHATNAHSQHSQTLGSNKKAKKPKHIPSADQNPTFPGLARHVGNLPFTSYGHSRGRGGATASAEETALRGTTSQFAQSAHQVDLNLSPKTEPPTHNGKEQGIDQTHASSADGFARQ
ncbi:hypothetical protein IE81DRAFT_324261 [Ceraceosorus guamensis]|uniref:Uncharacterized protein n=1 Tax=Ceraceosorus guamensis TaxID=1522189 RepID=A0A316VVY0_9BASI|nr:hypothetical protein IE81DRAFT_324261 [Ceraceosorus guamensis]PWN41766.1 hypothetical protein IE81DRAFT_324261 [Ceraceosorus guamensis]